MMQQLPLFIRATRVASWSLHLSSIRSMLPWFFSYDRISYAQYLSTYWLEMESLCDDHPDIHGQLQNGKFVVQRQQEYGFAQVACDQVIEQTANHNFKSKGGLTGFSVNKGAAQRWTLIQHERAGISK